MRATLRLSSPRLVGRAEHDLLHRVGGDPRPPDDLGHHQSGQIVRPDPSQDAPVPSLRGAHRIDDEGLAHRSIIPPVGGDIGGGPFSRVTHRA